MADKKKESLPTLDEASAGSIMANVFAACDMEPSTVPISVLSSYTMYRRDRCSLQKTIVVIMLVLFLLLPLFFVMPRYTVEKIAVAQTGVPTYEVTVKNWLPTRLVSARLNGKAISVYESDSNVYTVEPGENGTLTLTVRLYNRQYSIWTTDITGIDATAPSLVNSKYEDGKITIWLDDGDGVGADYAAAYGVLTNGTTVSPVSYTDTSVTFPFTLDMNLFLPDKNGNTLQLVLAAK